MGENHLGRDGGDPVDWDAVHDGTATEDDFLRWAESDSDDDED